jgi:hypothetical protein
LREVERDDQDDRGDFAIDGKVARAWRIEIKVKKSNLTNFATVFEAAPCRETRDEGQETARKGVEAFLRMRRLSRV